MCETKNKNRAGSGFHQNRTRLKELIADPLLRLGRDDLEPPDRDDLVVDDA